MLPSIILRPFCRGPRIRYSWDGPWNRLEQCNTLLAWRSFENTYFALIIALPMINWTHLIPTSKSKLLDEITFVLSTFISHSQSILEICILGNYFNISRFYTFDILYSFCWSWKIKILLGLVSRTNCWINCLDKQI